MEVDSATAWASATCFGLAGIFHFLHKANGKELRYMKNVVPIYKLKDLLELAKAGTLPDAVAVRGTVIAEEPLTCEMSNFSAVIKQVVQLHHRLKLYHGRWVPDRPIVAKKPLDMVPFSIADKDGVTLPIRLQGDCDVEDALFLAGSHVKPEVKDYVKSALMAEGGRYTYSQEMQENILAPGMEITAIGRVQLSRRTLQLLIQDLQKADSTCHFLAQACAAIGGIIIADQVVRSAWGMLQAFRRRRNERSFRAANRERLPTLGADPICCCCWENKPDMYFRDCGHALVCLDCSKKLHRRCPVCRTVSDCLPLAF